MNDRQKRTANARKKQSDSFRAHYERAVAELVWCTRHITALRGQGGVQDHADVRSLCGEHWNRMGEELAALACLCREQSKIQDDAGHVIVAAMLRGIADKFDTPHPKPLQAIKDGHELMGWLPTDVNSASENNYIVEETIFRLPVLDWRAKSGLLAGVRALHGRPPETRRIAVHALEMHNLGESWTEIERRFFPDHENSQNPGEKIRREVQHLKTILRKHSIHS